MNKAELFDALRGLMGSTQNGSGTVVMIYQDDATNTYHCKVGNKSYWGASLSKAIEEAVNAQPKED